MKTFITFKSIGLAIFMAITPLAPLFAVEAVENEKSQQAYAEELVDALPAKVSWQLDDRKALIEKFNALNADVVRRMSLERKNYKYSQEKHAELVKDVLWKYLINEQGKVVNPDMEIKEIAEAYAGIRTRPATATQHVDLLAPGSEVTTPKKLGDFDFKLLELLNENPGLRKSIISKEIDLLRKQVDTDPEAAQEMTASLKSRLKADIISQIAHRDGGKVDLPKESQLLDRLVNSMECKILRKPCAKRKTVAKAETLQVQESLTSENAHSACNHATAEKAFGLSGDALDLALESQYRESKMRNMSDDSDKNIRLILFNFMVMNRNNLFLANPEDAQGPLVDIAECVKNAGKNYELRLAEEEAQQKFRYNNRQESVRSAQ